MSRWTMGGFVVSVSACALITPLDELRSDAGFDASADGPIAEAGKPTSYHALVLADTPKSYWRFGETAIDAAIKDEIGVNVGAYTAVQLGVPGAIANDPNTAAAFDGGNSAAMFGDIFAFPGNAPCSFEAWVIATAPYPTTEYVFDRLATANDGWTIETGMSGQVAYLRLNHDAAANTSVVTPAALKLSTTSYTHVVVTFDGTTIVEYLNGVMAWSMANATPNTALAGILAIGVGWQGSIDEVAVYDYALDATKVTRHYQAGIGVADF